VYVAHGEEEKYMQNFSLEIISEEPSLSVYEQMGR
jgi:hypothetical protein